MSFLTIRVSESQPDPRENSIRSRNPIPLVPINLIELHVRWDSPSWPQVYPYRQKCCRLYQIATHVEMRRASLLVMAFPILERPVSLWL